MSVESVPVDEGAIGDGSATSLGLEAKGECCKGGCRSPNGSRFLLGLSE